MIQFSEVAERMMVKVKRYCGKKNADAVAARAREIGDGRDSVSNLVMGMDVQAAIRDLRLTSLFESSTPFNDGPEEASDERMGKIIPISRPGKNKKLPAVGVAKVSRKKGR